MIYQLYVPFGRTILSKLKVSNSLDTASGVSPYTILNFRVFAGRLSTEKLRFTFVPSMVVTTFLKVGTITSPVSTAPVKIVPVEIGGTIIGGCVIPQITWRTAASGLLVVCARIFLSDTSIGYDPGRAGDTVETVYFPGESSLAGRVVPSIKTDTEVSPGSASTVIVIPVPEGTSSPGLIDVLKYVGIRPAKPNCVSAEPITALFPSSTDTVKRFACWEIPTSLYV